MQVAAAPVHSAYNPFRSRADPPNIGEPPSPTDLEISPSALERASPSPPPGTELRSPSPAVTDTRPRTSSVANGEARNTSEPSFFPPQPHRSGQQYTHPLGPPPGHSLSPVSPSTTHVETRSTSRLSPPLPRPQSQSQPQYAPPPGPPPGHSTSVPPDIQEAITEELPPAYTPTADVSHGETTIEFGPRRPFARTSARSAHNATQRPTNTGASTWSAYPGRSSTTTRRIPPAPLIQVSPPPQHPALPPRSGEGLRSIPPRPSQPSSVSPSQPQSDFVRDFYSASTGVPPVPPRPGTEGSNRGNARSNKIPDDGRPTNKPTPGHPLLNSGKVLVYPAGYECSKCHNTGYKHYDPSNPCTKCWSKYAKVFTGPLTYAPWAPAAGVSAAENSASAGTNLQRPLPPISASSPVMSGHRSSQSLTDLSISPPPHHPSLSRASTTSRPSQNGWPPASWMDPGPPPPRTHYTPAPPPGATAVRPGDPRIGGRLCWRCGGSGTTSFLIFDEQTCPVCNGLGRTF